MATPIQANFTGGEISPRLLGRVDLTKYQNSLALCDNFLCFPHGGITKRSGTRFVAEVKDSSKNTRLIPFVFSTTQAYIIEFGHQYCRFYRDEGQILTGGGAIYEISSPYESTDLDQIDYVQSADVLYLCHPSYIPKKLSRTAHTRWTFSDLDPYDGPYLDLNTGVTSTTMYPSSHSANCSTDVTITASAVTGINGGSGFVSSDVGRPIRIFHTSKYGAAKITAVGGTTSVTVRLFCQADAATHQFGASGSSSATVEWQLGAWSDTTGWPSHAVFFQDRLFFANTSAQPNTVWASRSGDYENFSPNDNDGTVDDSHALNFTLATDQVNAIRWLFSSKNLQLGTSSGPFVMSSGEDNIAITPTNVVVNRETTDGVGAVKPVGSGKSTLYVDRSKRRIREFAYTAAAQGYISPDMTLIAEHTAAGTSIEQLALAKFPDNLIYVRLANGGLRSMTYERDQDVVAWARHTIGGSNVAVKSLATIPSIDETHDQVYMIVSRAIDKGTVTASTPLAVTASSDSGLKFTAGSAHGLSAGNTVTFTASGLPGNISAGTTYYVIAGGLTSTVFYVSTVDGGSTVAHSSNGSSVKVHANKLTLNGHGMADTTKVQFTTTGTLPAGLSLATTYFVVNTATNDFKVSTTSGGSLVTISDTGSGTHTVKMMERQYVEFLEQNFDTNAGDTSVDSFFVDSGLAYSGGAVTSLTGLGHLEGETVSVLANGAAHPDKVVSGGSISLDVSATSASVGLPYTAKVQTLDPEVATDLGPSQGKTRRVERLTFRVVDTYNLKFGTSESDLELIPFRLPAHAMDSITLFTGDKRVLLKNNPDRRFDFFIHHDDPLPCTILAIMYSINMSER